MERFGVRVEDHEYDENVNVDDKLDSLDNNIGGGNFTVYAPGEFDNTLTGTHFSEKANKLINLTKLQKRLGQLYTNRYDFPYNEADFNTYIAGSSARKSFRELIAKLKENYNKRASLQPKPNQAFYDTMENTGSATLWTTIYSKRDFFDTYELPAWIDILGIANDARPIWWKSNEQLAQARANAVKDYITTHMPSNNFAQDLIQSRYEVRWKSEWMSDPDYEKIPGVEISVITCGHIQTVW